MIDHAPAQGFIGSDRFGNTAALIDDAFNTGIVYFHIMFTLRGFCGGAGLSILLQFESRMGSAHMTF